MWFQHVIERLSNLRHGVCMNQICAHFFRDFIIIRCQHHSSFDAFNVFHLIDWRDGHDAPQSFSAPADAGSALSNM